MSELLDIIIQAVDNASGVFESITGTAQDMADTIGGGATATEEAFDAATQRVEELESALAAVYMGDLDADADQLEQELAEATAEAQRLGAELQNADAEIEGMSGDLDIINSSMLLQLGEQVGNLGSQAEGMAQEMNEAAISVGQLATQTGVAEPEMVSLINTISNATFPNDEAMMYVKALDQMGVSTQNFGKSATDMDKINDALGLGAPKVTALSNEMSVLGVDMNNVSSSFNALAYANSNTIGGMQNYQTFLTKYSADFADLGLNIDQASVVIAGATQKFGGGRAALTGLSKALKESNGDTKALEEALGLEAGAIENASQVTGEYSGELEEMASQEAQHKTLTEQLGAAWEDFSLSLSPVLGPLTSIIGLIGSVGSFGLQVSGLKTLVGTVREFNAVQTITNLLEGEGAIARVASAIGITTEAAAADTATVAFGGLAIAEGAALWPILAIAAAVAALVFIVYEVGKAFGWWTDVGSMIDVIWSGINQLWEAFINHPDVQALISAISDAIGVLWGWIQQAGQAIMEFFGISTSGDFDVVRALIDSIGMAWNNLKSFLMPVITGVQLVIQAFDAFRNGQMSLPDFIMTVLSTLVNVYSTMWTQIINLVVKFGSQLLSRGISAASRFVSGIINRIAQLPSRVYSRLVGVVSYVRSAIQAWITAGVKKVDSMIKSITSPFTGVADKISSALSGVVDAITAPFKSAWETVQPIIDKIKKGIDLVGDITGFYGGEGAYGGETIDTITNNEFNITTGEYTVDNSPIEINQNVTLDLVNVPAHIDTATLIKMIQDKNVLSAIATNRDFQELDGKVKQKLNLKSVRARGR